VFRRALLPAAVLLTFGACSSVTGPGLDLNGTWGWEYNLNPGGSDMTFSLAVADGKVTGAGLSHGIGPARTPDSMAVAGHQFGTAPYVSFELNIDFASGTVVTYVGRLVGANELDGTWTTGDQSTPVRFVRE
jgi:hypothetical protein